ncbi:hypothetical protein LIP_2109 [Limnochorda pilosa]|uniref:TIGR02677 family protein n=1 Tax=Limnochorda pilosa TaxID=1555112 RepID=A0A0K2SLG7_LIMPI|nr:hypothetical protein LIP_2109 [Limnochorda pilosa]
MLVSLNLRRLQRRFPEASYLVAVNVERYRPIMRLFYLRHMEHQYALDLHDVWAEIQAAVDPAYTEEQCEQDLAQLVEWGSLTGAQDRSRATTIQEFMRRHLKYSITPYGIALERLLSELEQEGRGTGSLNVDLLDQVLEGIDRLDRLLSQLPDRLEDGEERGLGPIYQAWDRTFTAYDENGKQASDYLAQLARNGEGDDVTDVEGFLAYKEVLKEYLASYVLHLMDVGDRVAAVLHRWQSDGLGEKLVEACARYEAHHLPMADGRLPALESCREGHAAEWRVFRSWFQPGGGLEELRRRTNEAVESVVRRVQRLTDRPAGLSRRRQLEELAVAFAACRTPGEAHRLAGARLGLMQPRHVSGEAQVFAMRPDDSPWRQRAYRVELLPVARGRRRRHEGAVPVRDRSQEEAEILRQVMEEQKLEESVWDRLFAAGELDLGALALDDVDLRDRLLALLGACLASPDRSALAPDGSTVRLLPPRRPAVGWLSAPDGSLALPAFRMVRRKEGERALVPGAGSAAALH